MFQGADRNQSQEQHIFPWILGDGTHRKHLVPGPQL